jgi:hypothetical protein
MRREAGHLARLVYEALINQSPRAVDVGQIKNLNLGPDRVPVHLGREVADQHGRILVHDAREVHRAGGKRGRVGPQVEGIAACALIAAAATRGELNDHAWTVLLDAGLDRGKKRRVGGRAFIGVAHVDINE